MIVFLSLLLIHSQSTQYGCQCLLSALKHSGELLPRLFGAACQRPPFSSQAVHLPNSRRSSFSHRSRNSTPLFYALNPIFWVQCSLFSLSPLVLVKHVIRRLRERECAGGNGGPQTRDHILGLRIWDYFRIWEKGLGTYNEVIGLKMRSSSIIQFGPKSSDKCSCKRRKWGRRRNGEDCGDGGRVE